MDLWSFISFFTIIIYITRLVYFILTFNMIWFAGYRCFTGNLNNISKFECLFYPLFIALLHSLNWEFAVHLALDFRHIFVCLSTIISWPASSSPSTCSSLPRWIVSYLPVLGGFFSRCGVYLSLHYSVRVTSQPKSCTQPSACAQKQSLALAVFVIFLRTLVCRSGQCPDKIIKLAGQ